MTTQQLAAQLATRKTTPYVRMYALAFALSSVPMLLFGFVSWYLIPLFFPVVVLHAFYWLIFMDKVQRGVAQAVWAWTGLYYFFMFAGTTVLFGASLWPFALFCLAAMGFAYVAGRDLNEEENKAVVLKGTAEGTSADLVHHV